MKLIASIRRTTLLFGVAVLARAASADVTVTTPYKYDRPPPKGTEGGTYMAAATGALGPDCFFTFIGTAKLLPNPDGTGGQHCFKGNTELSGSGPLCALKPALEGALFVAGGTYTYNGDGTLCESLKVIGGPLDGQALAFHTYIDPKGQWAYVTQQEIAYACPGVAANMDGVTSSGPGLKIGAHGDDPPGSGMLPCTNP
jgi:hypothetical protein